MAVQIWLHWQLKHNHCLDPLLSRVLEETCARYMYMYVNLSCKSLLSRLLNALALDLCIKQPQPLLHSPRAHILKHLKPAKWSVTITYEMSEPKGMIFLQYFYMYMYVY